MNKFTVTELSFFVLLLCIQIEGRIVDRVLEEFEYWGNVKDVNEISTGGRELTQSSAPASESAPPSSERREFEDEIEDAIEDCKENPGGRRVWMYGTEVIGTNIRIRFLETKPVCRCACQRASSCNAVNYEKRFQACVFHSGGTPILEPGWFEWSRRAWVKP